MKTRKSLSLFILLLSATMVVTDLFVSNLAVSSIQTYFHTTNAAIELILAGFLIGYAVLLIAGGRLGDRYGRKKMFILGMLLFSLFSLLCALSFSVDQLILFRFLEGISAALMSPQAIALIQVTFRNPVERSRAFGLFGVSLGVGCVIGILGGGLLLATHGAIPGWRLSFLITPIIGVAGVVLSLLYLEETPTEAGLKFDLKGLAILIVGLVSLIYPIIQGRQLGWPSWAFYSLAGSLIILYGFVRYQNHRRSLGRHVLIDTGIFRLGYFKTGLGTVLFGFAAHNAFILVYMLFIRHFAGPGLFHSIFPLICYGIGFAGSSYLSIRFVPLYGRGVPQTGLSIMIIALIAQVWLVYGGGSPYLFYVTLLVYGTGQGMFLPTLLNVTLTGLPKHHAGAAAGIYYTFQQFSSTLGVTVIGGVFFGILEHHMGQAYHAAFAWGSLVIILCLGAALTLLQRIPIPGPQEADDLKKAPAVDRPKRGFAYPSRIPSGFYSTSGHPKGQRA